MINGSDNVSKSSRKEWPDYQKGILMFGVVWGHLITIFLDGSPNHISIHWIIRTFDMPFFMLLSGYFLSFSIRKHGILTNITNKLTAILFPTILWSLISSLGRGIHGFYFLYAVFWSSIITLFCSLFPKAIRFILYTLFVIGFHCINAKWSNLSYLFPYFIIGFIINYEFDKERVNTFWKNISTKWSEVFIVAYLVMLCFWSTKYTIWNTPGYMIHASSEHYGIVAYRFLIGVIGIICAYFLFKVMYEKVLGTKGWFKQLMITSGRETLAIYILHAIFISRIGNKIIHYLSNQFGHNIFTYNDALLGYVIAPIASIILIYVCLFIIKLMKKSPYTRWVFGFKIHLPRHEKSC